MSVTSGYSLDYVKGEVSFEQIQNGVITAEYSHSLGSAWSIKPNEGTTLKILGTTVKFTSDVQLMGQSIDMQLFVAGTPYGHVIRYKNVRDLMKCSMAAPSSMEGFGDVINKVNFLPFDYITSKDLKSSELTEIRIWLSGHEECGGEFGIVSANCLSIGM